VRIYLKIAYNGTYFEGFQKQAHTQNTVIGALCKALRSIGIFTTPIGSGRTDAKVHALGQVVHMDLPHYWHDLTKLKQTLNKHLNPALHVREIKEVSSSFHARFDANLRHYRYIIWHGECQPCWAESVAFEPSFSISLANEALRLMEGEHDFVFFKKEGSGVKNNRRTLYEAFCYRRGNLSVFSFKANGFLRSQVRLMVGVAIAYANEKLTKEQIIAQVEAKKSHFRRPAPPEGLYLVRIHYPPYTHLPLT
jgi:tRNA pseudouridine38-40 synthase